MSSNSNDQCLLVESIISEDYESKGTFADRLQILIGEESGRQFASKVGITYSTLHNYLVNKSVPTLDNLVKLAEATNTNLNWLAIGRGSMMIAPEASGSHSCSFSGNIELDEFYFIPKYDAKASAGSGRCISDSKPLEFLVFSKEWVNNILKINCSSLFSIDVIGDSMSGEIEDGDTLLINKDATSLNDSIYMLRIDGDLFVKRVQKLPNQIVRISSANKVYEPYQIDMNNPPRDFEVIGKAVWIGRYIS